MPAPRLPLLFRTIYPALILCCGGLPESFAQAVTKTADGFNFPVAPPAGEGFYKSRGFRARGHLGEDWLVTDGSSAKSLGKLVYAIGNGLVVLARDIHVAWGNVVIVRHAWIENRQLKFADSLYAHLDRITVREGQQVSKGQQLGTIGNNHGMYPAHLHFEIHKDLSIGVNHAQGTRDLRSYWLPTEFITVRRKLGGGGRNVPTPAASFLLPSDDHPWFFHRRSRGLKGKESRGHSRDSSATPRSGSSSPKPSGTYRVNRYE